MPMFKNYLKNITSTKKFNQFRDEFIKDATAVSDAKSIEYTSKNDDKLKNFKSVGRRVGVTPMQALMTYKSKGDDAMCTYAKTGNQYSDENFRERCIDSFNYSILAAFLHYEQQNTHTEDTNDNNNTEPDRDADGNSEWNGPISSEPDKWSQLQRSSKT